MTNNKKHIIFIIHIIIALSVIFFNCTYAMSTTGAESTTGTSDTTVTGGASGESGGTGAAGATVGGVLGEIGDLIAIIAGFVCVIKIIQIGIMYMLTGAGGRGQAKTALMPWIVGTFICGFYAILGGKIIDLFPKSVNVLNPGSGTETVESIGSIVLGEFSVAAGAVALGMILYIGIKYMTSSALEKAQAKNTFVPWIIGLIIASSAFSIARIIVNAGGGAAGAGGAGTGGTGTEVTSEAPEGFSTRTY